MKRLMARNTKLNQLIQDVRPYCDKVHLTHQPKIPSNKKPGPMTKEEHERAKEQAARVITRAWRGKKVKETIVDSPYFAYLSLVDPADEKYQLSAIMFGRHVAELRKYARERIDNPLINMEEYYHRSVNLSNAAVETFLLEFDIPGFDVEHNTYMPITLLKNSPAEDILLMFPDTDPPLQLLQKKPYTIAVLVIPENNKEKAAEIREKVKNYGWVASSWEIAQNVRRAKVTVEGSPQSKLNLEKDLPKTVQELLASDVMIKLKQIAQDKKYATNILAKCLVKIIKDLPSLSPDAVQRIALMLDMTNTFYSHHYPRYAFCVYAIVHEISLSLSDTLDVVTLEKEFERFVAESMTTAEKALNLENDGLKESMFVATASTSGVNACALTLRIAGQMKTLDGKLPKVKILKPCYYELEKISNLPQTENDEDADIFMISSGPIVNPEGLTPGVDINLFVRKHFIESGRTKPVTILVDSTTALYKNMALDPDVKQWVMDGKISILVHESHQKFGLIHTDQAQYGRVFGWCSKSHFSEKDLLSFQENSKDDFNDHIDIRVGAFISTRCQDILEDIKKQHFSNGAILRNILIQTSLISKEVVSHEDMLKNFDELYFLNILETPSDPYTSLLERSAFGVIDYRTSFGHYTSSTAGVVNQRRYSPDASDELDCLVQACHIRFTQEHNILASLGTIIEEARTHEELSFEEQVVFMGMLHSVAMNTRLLPDDFGEVRLLTTEPTSEDIRKVLDPYKKPKDLLLIQIPGEPLRLVYASYENQFRQLEVRDSKLIEALQDGNLNHPRFLSNLKRYLHALQARSFPKGTTPWQVFSAMSNALECCPLLSKRQYGLNIKKWLGALQTKILQEFEPQKPKLFIDTLRHLYHLNISVNQAQLRMLSQQPAICRLLKNNSDLKTINSALIFYSVMAPTEELDPLLHHKDCMAAMTKVYQTNEEILASLVGATEKHRAALACSKRYLQICFKALHQYYGSSKQDDVSKKQLNDSIKHAETLYVEVLGKDRTPASKARRLLLAVVTNFIAAITLGYAHYRHYQKTGSILFFMSTSTESKLRQAHRTLAHEIEKGHLEDLAEGGGHQAINAQ